MAEPIAERPSGSSNEHPTVPIEPVAAAQTEVIDPVQPAFVPAPTRRKRHWVGWLVAIVLLIVLLVVAFFVGDALVRDYARDYVRERVVSVLQLEPDAAVEVDLGTGSLLLQVLGGSVREVNVGIEELSFGDVSGSATLSATGVPLDETRPVESLDIEVTVSEANVRKLAGFMSGLELDSIALENGIIAIDKEFVLFGFVRIPVGIDLLPAATGSGISFEPQTVTLGDDDISVADLRNNELLSGLAGQLLATREFCVAEYLPEALAIERVEVVGTTLVVSINGDGAALGGAALSTTGTCP